MSQHPALLVHQALVQTTQDQELLKRLGEGDLHEDMLLVAVFDLVQEAGLPTRMWELASSNQPLADRDDAAKWNSNYHYATKVFLEVADRYLRVEVDLSKYPAARAVVLSFNDCDDARIQMGVGEYSSWREVSHDEFGYEPKGAEALALKNDLGLLRAELSAAHMDQETAIAQPASPRTGPRL